MWNKPFEKLRRRMTCLYATIFGVLILVIVAAAYTFIWWEILAHEKENLVAQIYHEGEEWVESEEAPCSEAAIRSGKMLAYFVNADGSKVILNQLGTGEAGQELMSHKDDWPKELNTSRLLRMHGANGERYRYLAAVAPVIDGESRLAGFICSRIWSFITMLLIKHCFCFCVLPWCCILPPAISAIGLPAAIYVR